MTKDEAIDKLLNAAEIQIQTIEQYKEAIKLQEETISSLNKQIELLQETSNGWKQLYYQTFELLEKILRK